ncbi:MAG TPA: ABC transporter substrate-binding protein [Xanthobacteraceae bacterium]|nr:ABC transporter substrate-binding protein [Xanthobacteraceae bacterium]
MLNRRSIIRGTMAALGAISAYGPIAARGQAKPLVKVRYNEVVRSLLYAPAYVAISKGYFKDAGLEVELATANGGDKSMAALLSNSADIALMGPEAAIYVLNSDSTVKPRIFCGLTATDGFMLVGRAKVDKFDWSMLKGKDILGFRPGSTPLLFLEEAMRMNGVNPDTEVKLVNNVAIPARVGSWLAGQNQYAIFIEPDASQLELDGKAFFLASIGGTVGPADYTAFMATDKYIGDNPAVVQSWTNAIYRAQKWTATASAADIAQTIGGFFPGVAPQALTAAAARYQKLKIWKTSPVIEPAAIDKFQDILVHGHVLDADKRVKFQDLVRTEFASKAI